jgi:hypothetical protein
MSESFDPFARHRQGRSEEPGSGPRPGANMASSELARDLQKLHEWIQHWGKPTVCLRDICYRGPNSIRDRKKAIGLAEILVGHGWLLPIRTRRRDMREWQIVRGVGGNPTIGTMATAAARAVIPQTPS